MREWANREGVDIVLPLTERSCVFAMRNASAMGRIGITVGCGANEMLQNAFDKELTLRYAEACGVRIPPTHFPKSLDDCLAAVEQLGFPCVVKSRWSNAWNGKHFLPNSESHIFEHARHLAEIVAEHKQGEHWPLIQGYVAGQGKGVFALCDRGRVIAWFAHERLRDTRPTGSSSSLRRSVHLEPRLREPAENSCRN